MVAFDVNDDADEIAAPAESVEAGCVDADTDNAITVDKDRMSVDGASVGVEVDELNGTNV